MKKTMTTFILAGALALAGLPALAADPLPQQQPSIQSQKARLENGYNEIARRNVATKLGGMQQAELAKQQREIKDLLQKLDAGQQVAPGEVDRVLQSHY